LISSPMVNEVALIMLFGMFGLRIALIYLALGLTVAIFGGLVIGKLKLEHLVEGFVYETKLGDLEIAQQSWRQRLEYAYDYVLQILRKVWPYVLAGIAIGGWIHGYVPEDALVRWAGPDNPFAVPIAVLLGVPLYSNAAGTIPIVAALREKGMAIGTVLAFMMAVTAISLPEIIILRNVLKPKLIAIFVGIMAVTIIIIGYIFNWLIPL